MYGFVVTVFVLVCLLQMIAILLQSSKGGGLAGAFGGGGGMGAMFGSRGTATFLSKLTAGLATAFMILALVLAMMASRGGSQAQGIVEEERQARGSSPAAILPSVPATQQPATPVPAPPTTTGDSAK